MRFRNHNQSFRSRLGWKASFNLPTLFLALMFMAALFGAPRGAQAQISPQEILNPRVRALEQTYLPRLVAFNQAIQAIRFPFPFLLRRYVGLTERQNPAPDTRGLQFLKFHNQIILKISGDYRAAFNSSLLTRNQRAARAFENVIVPILQILPQQIPASVPYDGVGFEISYHVRTGDRNLDYEGAEDLVVILRKSDALAFSKLAQRAQWQEVLNRSKVYIDRKQFGLDLVESEPIPLEALDDSPMNNTVATSATPATIAASAITEEPASSQADDSLVALDRQLSLGPQVLRMGSESKTANVQPPAGLAVAATTKDAPPPLPAAPPTQSEIKNLQARYQTELNALATAGVKQMDFVSYAPPFFVLFQNHIYLQITLRNPRVFDVQTSSIYKRAAQSFDLFLAPQLKALLTHVPSDPNLAGLDITVLNDLGPKPGASSEAVEFICPIGPLRQFADAQRTNQDLINHSIVLVNGVRIALNLQLVE